MDGTRKYPEWGSPITIEYRCSVLTDKWILAQKLGIPKIQFTNHMKFKKKDQSVDSLIHHRRGNKMFIVADTEIKCGAESEGKATETAPPGDPTLIQLPNPDTIVDANKCLLIGA